MCPLCGEYEEIAVHLFEGMWESLPISHVEKVITVCWAIWNNRNKTVFESHGSTSGTVVRMALLYLQAWKVAQTNGLALPQHPNNGHVSHFWQLPPQGCTKINVDATIDSQQGYVGIGCRAGF